MRAKIFFITLAVDDLDRSAGFYRDGLGWPTEGIVGQEFHDEVTSADGTTPSSPSTAACCSRCMNAPTWPRTRVCRPGRPARPSSAWVSPPSRRRRSTGCSSRSKPLAARGQHPRTCARLAFTPGTSPIPMVNSSKSPGTPTSRTGRRILGASFRGPQRGCTDWRDRSAFGIADLRRVVKTAEGLTCQPKIAAAGSVTLRNGHQRS
jgi:hypothetical protein